MSHHASTLSDLYVICWIQYEITHASRLITDPFLAITTILLALTVAVTLIYYDRIRRVSKAYEEAKSVVTDIVVSFDRQIQRQDEQLAASVQRLETLTVRSEKLSRQFEQQDTLVQAGLQDLKARIPEIPEFTTMKHKLESVSSQIEDLAKAHEELKQHSVVGGDMQVETAIPIRRERALAPLTDTELRVLEFIAEEGEKTAPQIREVINLTREHTARLMKKLYQEGYLERRSERAPYSYRVKEEMLKFLKKTEAN